MALHVASVGEDEIERWTRDIDFTYDDRQFEGWLSWSPWDSYSCSFAAKDGGPLPDIFDDYDFLSDLDDLSLLVRRQHRTQAVTA